MPPALYLCRRGWYVPRRVPIVAFVRVALALCLAVPLPIPDRQPASAAAFLWHMLLSGHGIYLLMLSIGMPLPLRCRLVGLAGHTSACRMRVCWAVGNLSYLVWIGTTPAARRCKTPAAPCFLPEQTRSACLLLMPPPLHLTGRTLGSPRSKPGACCTWHQGAAACCRPTPTAQQTCSRGRRPETPPSVPWGSSLTGELQLGRAGAELQ